MFARGLVPLSIASVVLIIGAFALVFFYAPNDADQGFVQKIFYLHVPLAIVALCGFVAGGIYGIRYLRSGDRAHDLRSYVAIHLSLILAVGVLLTGSIWGRRPSWGTGGSWDEPTLVSFLIVFLLYACYQPLRFSIEDPERQARYAAVFAIVGGAFVPLNFMAVRLAEPLLHPRVLTTTGGSMPGAMRLTFLVSLLGMAVLFVTLWKYELTSKQASMQLRALKRRLAGEDDEIWAPVRRSAAPAALMPALPLDDAGPYVAAAYLVFLALVLIYVAIMASKLARIAREIDELAEHRRRAATRRARRPSATSSRRPCGDERAARPRHVAQDRAARRCASGSRCSTAAPRRCCTS